MNIIKSYNQICSTAIPSQSVLNIYIEQQLESERLTTSKILDSKEECNRLCGMVKAEYNDYDRSTELFILKTLNNVLLMGFDSKEIKHPNSIYHIYNILTAEYKNLYRRKE